MTEHHIDIIKGVFYGQAIGDALGLGTEFLDKKQIAEYYPNGLSDYHQIFQDEHRKRWEKGDWTDDTDQFLCICDSIILMDKVDEFCFAEELHSWFKGIPMGIGKTVFKVVSFPQFTKFPHKAAELVWKANKEMASNGAIMRTSILGTFEFWDEKKVVDNTENIAKVTHWDKRCIGSCVIVSAIISNILRNDYLLSPSEIVQIGEEYDDRIKEYVALSLDKNIEMLNLDEANTVGYTLKALSAALWAYFNATDFESGLLKVIHEGGDADTNASVAASILGAKFGYHSIPQKYIDGLINRDELAQKMNLYISKLKDKFEKRRD